MNEFIGLATESEKDELSQRLWSDDGRKTDTITPFVFSVFPTMVAAGVSALALMAEHGERKAIELNVPVCTRLAEGGDLTQFPHMGTILRDAQSLDEVVQGCSEEVQVYLTRECVADSIEKSYVSGWNFDRPLLADAIKEEDLCVGRD